MPAEECNNGLWKWGETGECKMNLKKKLNKIMKIMKKNKIMKL